MAAYGTTPLLAILPLFANAGADEIQRLCFETRSLRLRAAIIVGEVALAAHQLRLSLAERQRLKFWSGELRVSDGEGQNRTRQNAQEWPPSL